MLTRYKVIWMVGIMITGLMGLVLADQNDFIGIFQKNGGFAIKSDNLKQVGRELRATVPSNNRTGTIVPLQSSKSKDPRAKIIQEALDEKTENE